MQLEQARHFRQLQATDVPEEGRLPGFLTTGLLIRGLPHLLHPPLGRERPVRHLLPV